jgi:transposase
VAIRVRMLLLLKTEAANSLKDVCPLLGYQIAQVTRWWECYKTRGLDALVEQHPHAGKSSQMTQDAWAGLEHVMSEGRIGTLEEARLYLEREWHIGYKSVNALSWLFKRRKIKWKTGRRRHRKAKQEQQDAFKKTSEASSERNR